MRFSQVIAPATAFLALLALSIPSHAGELDNEHSISTEQVQAAQFLPKTLVVRVKAGQVEVLHSAAALKAAPSTLVESSTDSYVKLDASGAPLSELDRDSSDSSWGFTGHYSHGGGGGWGGGYHGGGGWHGGDGGGWHGGGYHSGGNWYTPSYSYGGYNYNYYPYYSYYSGGYNYFYYGWPFGGYNPYYCYTYSCGY